METRWANSPSSLFLVCFFIAVNLNAATGGLIAAISSHATTNSRPLVWQSFDSSEEDVALCFFSMENYDFIGLIQNNDSLHVLGGLNSAGFGVVQSGAHANSKVGVFIKNALGMCGRVKDFLQLLEQTDSLDVSLPLSFACLDRFGECVVVETPNLVYDTHDKDVCPQGLCVRSDFIFSAESKGSLDFWRYHRAVDLLSRLENNDNLHTQTLLSMVIRDLQTPVLDPYPLPYEKKTDKLPEGYIPTRFAINQHNTVAAFVIEGVHDRNDTFFPTLWCVLGNPCCSAVVPLWPQTGRIPKALAAPDAFLNSVFQSKKDRLFSFRHDPTFLDSQLYMRKRAGYFFKIHEYEKTLFTQMNENVNKWSEMDNTALLKELSLFQKKNVNICTKLLR